ncbi:hypothetical protein AbraIFM66950_003620 [Aspergillus brasiliensis]|nr:hypothetical protein AbraIFM66950_003620 [Aspergillus brasiliensis]
MPIPAFAPALRELPEAEVLSSAADGSEVKVDEEVDAVDEDVDVTAAVAVTGYFISQPTISIAPTVESVVNVVVAIAQAVWSLKGVDPYVKVCPE